jgi:hypothetical protein
VAHRITTHGALSIISVIRHPMDDPRNEESAAAASESSPGRGTDFSASLRRRKVRKGTRSCWECKRRKIRCMLASPGDATCIGCQHRRVPCVPQELPGDPSPSPAKKDNQRLGQRIARVENFMKDFLASRHDGRHESDGSEPRRRRIPRGSPDATRPRSYEPFHTSPEVQNTTNRSPARIVSDLSLLGAERVRSESISPHAGLARCIGRLPGGIGSGRDVNRPTSSVGCSPVRS